MSGLFECSVDRCDYMPIRWQDGMGYCPFCACVRGIYDGEEFDKVSNDVDDRKNLSIDEKLNLLVNT